MSRAIQAALAKLKDSDTLEIAGSKLSKAQQTAMDNFCQTTGVVTRSPKGRGFIYRATDRRLVERYYSQYSGGDHYDDDTPQRAANIARNRSSKSAQYNHEQHYLLIKSIGSVQWTDNKGHVLDLTRTTEQLGAAAMTIFSDPEADQGWSSDVPIWLVENQALFDRIDWLPTDGPATLAYYGGHLRNDLIQWLSQKQRASHVYFFPDYDGVGLQNYARVRRALKDQVSFWLMPDWRQQLATAGSNELWQKTLTQFLSVIAEFDTEDDSGVKDLIQEMQSLAMALEQEAVWLPLDVTKEKGGCT